MKFTSLGTAPPVAANDNKPAAPRYRGTLPALRWLNKHDATMALAIAAVLPKQPTNWFVEVEHSRLEIRPTVGELAKAAAGSKPIVDAKGACIRLGDLKFKGNLLTEWGTTKKGVKLRPVDRLRGEGSAKAPARNIARYLATKPTTPSPMAAEHYHRPLSGQPALMPMLDPRPAVEAGRALLRQLGVDGSVRFKDLPAQATVCPTVVAEDAGFIGGVSHPRGNTSSGAVMWETPEPQKGIVATVVDEVAARGDLTSIGIRLGYGEADALEKGKDALLEVGKILVAANDNKKSAKIVARRSVRI